MAMKFYQKDNVWDAALKRINRLFDEFENITVSFSGGKDSTVCLQLALMVAEERGRLPLDVVFIDQEAEWQSVIDYIRSVISDPRIRPHWLQCPIILFNATSTSTESEWLKCWEPGKKWMREKEPDSIKDNVYGTERFKELFDAFMRYTFPGMKACSIGGVRCEESPARTLGLTGFKTYKDITWGKKTNTKDQYVFYPLYDWSYTDIWKAIHANKWDYCKIYDYQYQYGIPVLQMRVSNLHHETAIKNLFYLQEVEPETWLRLTERLSGINTAGMMQYDFLVPKELPWMFQSWVEYRDHLLENMIKTQEHIDSFRAQFKSADIRFIGTDFYQKLIIAEIRAILANDFHGTLISNFRAAYQSKSNNAGSRPGKRVTYDPPATI